MFEDAAHLRLGEADQLVKLFGQAQIVTNVEASADQVGAIATASEEQSAASEEINHSITQVNEMSNQTAQAMGEAAQAVAELARQAQALNQLITEMKQG